MEKLKIMKTCFFHFILFFFSFQIQIQIQIFQDCSGGWPIVRPDSCVGMLVNASNTSKVRPLILWMGFRPVVIGPCSRLTTRITVSGV